MKLLTICLALVATWWVIVFKLVQLGHMKTLALLLALLALHCPRVSAQPGDAPEGSRIAAAMVSGIDTDRLSPGLRREIDALVGAPLDTGRIDALARRLESERPGTVVATRRVLTDQGAARVIFLVAVADDVRDDDVNARYIVETVEVEGIDESRLGQELRDALHAVVGTRLTRKTAEQLIARVRDQLPGYDVTRRMSRGSERGRLRMTVLVRPGESMRWLHFTRNRSKFLFHGEQGWSGVLDLTIGTRDWRVTPMFAMSNADDLVEEYSGYGVRVEGRNVGSEEVGFSLELSTFEAGWRDATRAALAATPTALAYRTRSSVSPLLRVALSPSLHLAGGVSITQLTPDDSGAASEAANTYVLGAAYDREWSRGAVRHDLTASADVRAASKTLQSDFDYTRYVSRAMYRARWGRNALLASAMGGGITGQAPLFERFTLGDSATLRGWDKFDIAPLGGNRVGHASVEYRHRGVALFLEGGSVWQARDEARMRFSTGLGYHRDGFFATLGIPLNTSDVRTTFMIGVRF